MCSILYTSFATMKIKIDIYKDWCKKCGICAAFCPQNVLDFDESGYPFTKYPEKCTVCRLCEIRCPDFAIVVSKLDNNE